MDEEFHERLARIATRHNLSQRELANACGITAASMNQWFSGKTKSYDAFAIARLANYLGMDVNVLLGIDPSTGSPIHPIAQTPIHVGRFELKGEEVSFHFESLTEGLVIPNLQHPMKLKACVVEDDWSAPLFARNDLVLIDRRDTDVCPGSAYAVFLNRKFALVTLCPSENKDFFNAKRGAETFLVPKAQLVVVGRVCHCVQVKNF